MLSIVAFYFWQKSMQYKEVDSLVKGDDFISDNKEDAEN